VTPAAKKLSRIAAAERVLVEAGQPMTCRAMAKRRDALLVRLPSTQQPEQLALAERQWRSWDREQLDRRDELAQRPTVDLPERQLVEAFVRRIELFPATKTGAVVLHGNLKSAVQSSCARVFGGAVHKGAGLKTNGLWTARGRCAAWCRGLLRSLWARLSACWRLWQWPGRVAAASGALYDGGVADRWHARDGRPNPNQVHGNGM
jgi:hypothetical protein